MYIQFYKFYILSFIETTAIAESYVSLVWYLADTPQKRYVSDTPGYLGITQGSDAGKNIF